MNISQTAEQKSLFRRFVRPFKQHRWISVAFVLLVAAILSVAALSPQGVLAQFQQWLGYVPGIGFVELEQARILVAPVEVTQDEVTVRVSSVVAQKDKTVVVFSSQGLPAESEQTSERSFSALPELVEGHLEMTLELPDGRLLNSETWHLNVGAGTVEFPALPAEVYRVSLHLSELPLVAEGTLPQNWSLPLALQPVTGELLAELYPEPYSPAQVSDTQNGVTVRLLSVVHAPEETLLELQGEWSEPEWEYFYFDHGPLISLQDDVGHFYHERGPSNSGSFTVVALSVDEGTEGERHFSQKETKAFSPVSLAAQRFSLELPHVVYELPVSAEFKLDLGDKPQIGDYWPLDIRLEVAEVPIHIRGVRLKEEIPSDLDPRQQEMYQLLFDVEPFPAEATRSLQSIHLRSHPASNGGGSSYSSLARQVEPELTFAKIPSGQLQVKVEYATVILNGPWQLEWSLPDISAAESDALPFDKLRNRESAGVQPATLQPDCDIQRHNGVALCLEEVALTDRLTSVKVRAEEIPADTSFDVRPYEHEAYLTDDRGNRYDYVSDYAWQSDTPLDEQLPPFAPLSTLATNATLHLPEVRLNLYDSYGFEVTVPEEVPLHTNKVGIESSDTWPISIPVELADYHLRFTEAQIIQNGSRMMLSLTSEPFAVQEDTYAPKYLHLGTVTTPNGQTRKIGELSMPLIREGGYIGQQEDGTFSATLLFDISDPQSKSIITGRYQVNLSSITVVVPGAWELSFPVRGR